MAAPRPFVRGVAIGHYSDIRDAELTAKLNELRWMGASHISVVVSWSTSDIRSTKIEPHAGTTTSDEVLLRMLTRARALGFKVFLFPILDVQLRKTGEWRGALRPTDWDQWWRSYHRFILHYARIASRAKVDLYCVGSELVTTEHMRERWQQLIAKVRRTTSSGLVYSANWDHYEPVKFWDLVDTIGVTGYYKLADVAGASPRVLLASWRRARARLRGWSRAIRRPFIFTEVGYPSISGGAVAPWDYTRQTPVSVEEQRRAYEAFIRAWSGVPELGGVFIWDWYGPGGKDDRRYTPRGKPAAGLLRSWFLGMEQ